MKPSRLILRIWNFLKAEWGLQVVVDFMERVEEIAFVLSQNPKVYPYHKNSNLIRRCVVNKHISLFYLIESDSHVGLITFWNNHQDPKKLRI